MAKSQNKNRGIKRRRTIEIYFILYLAALVFILPNKHDRSDSSDKSGSKSSSFMLQTEKSALFCRAMIDSSGLRIVSIDSVNTVFCTGKVKDVAYEFLIEDQSLKQSLKLSAEKSRVNRFFRIEENPASNSASFYWIPPLVEAVNKTYMVTVTAKGRSEDGDDGIMTSSAKFSLNVVILNGKTFPDNIIPSVPQINPAFVEQPLYSYRISDDPLRKTGLSAEQVEVKAIAGSEWRNTVYASFINLLTELQGEPEISIVNEPADNGGEVFFPGKTPSQFELRGKTPSFGRSAITVKIRRKSDLEEASVKFFISPVNVDEPEFPGVMYPEKTYLIDPKLPLGNSKAVLRSGNRELFVSNQGGRFQFTPDAADTGKTIRFERYIDGNLYGRVYGIRISEYSAPEILDIRRISDTKLDVVTTAYGTHNREKNEVCRFIIEGNAVYLDLRGNIKDDRDWRIQHFTFTPKNPSEPFKFKITAVDLRGRRSAPKYYE